MASGVGDFRMMPSDDEMGGTCILHFTSSIGVRTSEVKAPEIAPVRKRADSGNGLSGA